ncbi:hypothetical protein A3C39_05825 [Candidatus Saccharibacteria bacterium RIFCSPHIGHO2_02_FULL_46_12]|nr:MAG: hypothetical protein A3C39_05825 [Candidatus Saccharibacteria bacterium RIFCSPHIGHO2_02_FULL_46_12]
MATIILAVTLWALATDIHSAGVSWGSVVIVAGLSTAVIACSIVSYFFIPEKFKTISAYVSYLLLVITAGLLVVGSGANTSPFIALWMVTAVFAGIFGSKTTLLLFAGVNAYFLWQVVGGEISKEAIVSIVLAGELPILISYILWHSKSSHNESSKDRAYYDLANELNQVSNKAEVVINAIGDGVIAVDNQGMVELINPAAQRIVGWGRQDAIGLDYKSVLQLLGKNGHELDKAIDPIFDVLTTNQQKRSNDLLLQTNSGKRLNVSIVASPIGRLGAGAIIVFRDITKELAEEHEQAEFISTASHEMRTPVASIEGYLGLALNPATATVDQKARDFITKAHESAQHLGRLFQDLLDVSKADDGRLSNNPKVINIVSFTNDIITGLIPKAEEKGLRIFFKPSTTTGGDGSGVSSISPMYYIHLDSDHLREVLSNLIENAVKYTPKGEVVVDITGDNTHVVISVSDSGIGIPAEDIPHLFQKFYRVDNSDTREIGGTGLGLYLCRRLIEAMNGRIWVESEYKKGSTFFVEVPRITHEEANRLIESSIETQNTEPVKAYVRAADLSATPDEQASALNTPLILSHGARLEAPTLKKLPDQDENESTDPLMGGASTPQEAAPARLTVQVASIPAPAAVAPASTVVPPAMQQQPLPPATSAQSTQQPQATPPLQPQVGIPVAPQQQVPTLTSAPQPTPTIQQANLSQPQQPESIAAATPVSTTTAPLQAIQQPQSATFQGGAVPPDSPLRMNIPERK